MCFLGEMSGPFHPIRKPWLRLHFHLFDGKTPLWWVEAVSGHTTAGYVDPANAIREAARL